MSIRKKRLAKISCNLIIHKMSYLLIDKAASVRPAYAQYGHGFCYLFVLGIKIKLGLEIRIGQIRSSQF